MARLEYRDRHGRIIGWRDQIGKQINVYDATGRRRGWYDPGDNRTRDFNGVIVGTGDLLSTLINS